MTRVDLRRRARWRPRSRRWRFVHRTKSGADRRLIGARCRARAPGARPAAGGLAEPALQHRGGVIVVGAGVAGLGRHARRCAPASTTSAFDSRRARSNSRGHAIAGIACPLGAHYRPVPGEAAIEVIELLDEPGARVEHGRPVYTSAALPQPAGASFIDGHWHEGLLPVEALPAAERAASLADYRRSGAAVAQAGGAGSDPDRARRPARRTPGARCGDLAHWLDAEGYASAALRWY
jgi:hypothetical protein